MTHSSHPFRPSEPVPLPLPFPVETARVGHKAAYRLQELARRSNRQIDAMAFQMRCLGWFDSERDGPRAA